MFRRILITALVAVMMVTMAASAAEAGGFSRSVNYHRSGRHTSISVRTSHYHRPSYHRSVLVRRYVPRPVYIPRPIYVASRPIYIAPRPVVVQAPPVMVAAPPVITQQLQIPEGFVETGRDYHEHGSDAGLVDELKGVLNGKKVVIEYNDDGSIHEIEDD